ncbi:hypothetical protein HYFRA_00014053 [Hymenoscyphus fraxineus]|uniref:2EXR domain-containing protein n=1 Tax=Hymenoscyphus fraxineus TaxID=746836 RepID=A0A9N9LB70_9HELO|nr:hypothetical protein HYFRA_00014053 [Hymenoscyphus fraxineus]
MASPTSTSAEGCDAQNASPTCVEKDPRNEIYRSLTIDEEMEIRLYCCDVLDRTQSERANLKALRATFIQQSHQIDIELLRLDDSRPKFFKEDDNSKIMAWRHIHDKHYQVREKYDRAVEFRIEELRRAFQYQLLHQGIKKTQNTTIPAYTFNKFLKLPWELRQMIWELGTGHKNPKVPELEFTRAKLPFSNPSAVFFSPVASIFPLACRSGVYEAEPPCPLRETPPALLHTCRESRAIAQKVFFVLPGYLLHGGHSSHLYFNSLFGNFYIEGTSFWDHVILICLLAKFGSPKPLLPEMLPYVNLAQSIRHLTVSLEIFLDVPVKYWFEFTSLRTLSVGISKECKDADNPDDGASFLDDLEIPIPGTNDAKRAEHVLSITAKAFKTFTKENPKFKCPKIEVVMQRRYSNPVELTEIPPGDGTELELPLKWSMFSFQAIQLNGYEHSGGYAWFTQFVGEACQDEVNRHKPGVACACLGTFVDEVDLSTMFDWLDGY